MARNRDAGELQYFLTYREERDSLSSLSAEQKGRLYEAKFSFFFDGAEPDFTDDQALAVLWSLIGPKLNKTAYHIEPLPIGAWFEWKRELLSRMGDCPTAFLELSPEDLPDVRRKSFTTSTDVL